MKKLVKWIIFIFMAIMLLSFLSSCQKVFTTSFFGFLKSDPADLPPERLSDYGWDVIANGTNEEVEEVYTAVTEALVDNPTDPELNYVAANLALEQIGVNDILEDIEDVMEDPEQYIADVFTAENIALLEDAGDYYYAAVENDGELTQTDFILCGTGLLLATVTGATPEEKMTNLSTAVSSPTPDQQEILDFVFANTDITMTGDLAADLLGSFELF